MLSFAKDLRLGAQSKDLRAGSYGRGSGVLKGRKILGSGGCVSEGDAEPD